MKSKDSNLRYPIGPFEYGKSYSLEETRRHIRTIAKLPKELKKALKKLRSSELDMAYRKGGWSVRQVIHHIADSHINAYIRMKLAVTEPTPVIKPYEEANWAETEDGKTAPVKLSLKLLAPLHRRWVMFLESLSEEDLERGYFHPEMQRVIPLPEAIALYAWHSQHHLAHIRLVADGKGYQKEATSKLAPAASRAAKPRPKGHKARAIEKSAAPAPVRAKAATGERKKPGPKPKAKSAATAAPTSTKAAVPGKRKRRTKTEMEAARAREAALKATGAASGERKKPGPKPKPKAASDAPKLSRAEILAKARAARAANLAKQAPAKPKAAAAAATPKRTRRSSAEVAAEKAAKAAAKASGQTKRRGMSPEHMAKIREARMAKRAAAVAGGAKPAPKPKPASNAPKLTRAEILAKARAARMANLAQKPASNAKAAPTRTRRSSAEVAAEKAAKAAAKASGQTKRKGMSPERMAEIRALRGKK